MFTEDLKAISISAAKKVESENDIDESIARIPSYDHRITNVYLLDKHGNIKSSLFKNSFVDDVVNNLFRKELEHGPSDIITSEVHTDLDSQFKVISILVPLQTNDNALVICFRFDQYQKEMLQEFMDNNYSIAVFDKNNYPIIWPFDEASLEDFVHLQDSYFWGNIKYNVKYTIIEKTDWKVYFFFRDNNFETYRAITILLLVFALYACLYQLFVEFWGVNTAKTYFENIDFAIFNQINEGVIIANNSGLILFANEAAHNIFANRRSTLRNIKLKELFSNVDIQDGNDKSLTLSLKFGDKLYKTIHSPIVKTNKILGSLTVIRNSAREDNEYVHILDKLIESIPQGILFVDKNHQISFANLIAKYLFGNLNIGTNVGVVDPELAENIYSNIDSGGRKRIELKSFGLTCDIVPVYDVDGIYDGTLVLLLPPAGELINN
ncbi:hypothetical protein N752_23980 [Desulforamulus aquiferis]|nr:PAS domain-containing protein [Desulforamulus aquiferis]RYD02394.1 hypothetical protein N752_23980 [Desulforamulus aquiferis]